MLPIEGDSITPVFDRQPIKRTSPFFIEHQKNAFVRDGDWKLMGKNLVMGTEVKAEKWELYHLAKDRTELNDLSKVNPEKRKQLAAAWNEWATRTGVFRGASTKEMKEKKTKKQKTGVDINLWENEVPGFPADFEHKPYTQQDPERITDTSRPSMRIFPAQGKPIGKALIILPGGSYRILADKKEGDRVAEFYASKGITCFVVRYRVTKHDHEGYRFPGPLLDARQSIRMVKSMAKKYGYSADQVGVMGFSAGGHLASMCATRFDDTFEGENSNGDVRPAFVALIYPVASMIAPSSHGGSKKAIFGNNPNEEDLIAASPERRVKKGYPPLFIAHNEFDPVDAKAHGRK